MRRIVAGLLVLMFSCAACGRAPARISDRNIRIDGNSAVWGGVRFALDGAGRVVEPESKFTPEEGALAELSGFFSPSHETRREERLLEGGLRVINLYGAEEGSAIYVVAGVHGDERAGQYAAALLEDAGLRAGSLHILARANPWGCERQVRETEQGRDLNRSFSDDGRNGEGERLAAAIRQDILAVRPVLILDLHEANIVREDRDFLGNSLIAASLDGVAELILAMLAATEAGERGNTPFALYGSSPMGSLNRHFALEQGIPVITIETFRGFAMEERVACHLDLIELALRECGLR